MTPGRVLIVGGGIAGLTSAIALKAKGWSVDVVEQDPNWAVYGVGIIQQANVVRAVAELGVLDDYLAASFPFDAVEMFAPNGAHVASLPAPRLAGAQYPANLGISRPALHKVLCERALRVGATVKLGMTVSSFSQDAQMVSVDFSDGARGVYDLMVGSDGLYSRTREALFGDAHVPRFTGQAVWRYNLPRTPDVTGLHVYTGPTSVGLVPLSNDLMYMFVTSSEPGNPRIEVQGRAAAMRQRLAGACDRVAQLRDLIVDDDAVVYRPLETLFIDGNWFKGRVILVGDAAHATTPHLGQGAGMAIEDSLVLADELARAPTVDQALQGVMTRRLDRCRFIVQSSIEVGEWQLAHRTDVDNPGMVRRMFEVTAQPI